MPVGRFLVGHVESYIFAIPFRKHVKSYMILEQSVRVPVNENLKVYWSDQLTRVSARLEMLPHLDSRKSEFLPIIQQSFNMSGPVIIYCIL